MSFSKLPAICDDFPNWESLTKRFRVLFIELGLYETGAPKIKNGQHLMRLVLQQLWLGASLKSELTSARAGY
jgi:hypothetical protein